MKIPNRIRSDKMNLYSVLRSFVALLTQVTSTYSFIGTVTNHPRIVPFDLSDVARAFDGSFASRFAYLEASPPTAASTFDSAEEKPYG
jgi:hypothetical protein